MADTSRDSLGRTCKPNVDWATATCHGGTADGTTYRLPGFPSVSSNSQSSARRLPHLALRYCRLSRVPTTVLRSPPRILRPPAMVGGPVSRPRPPPFLLALPRTGGAAAGPLICPDPSLRDPAFCGGPCRSLIARVPRSGCPFFSLSLLQALWDLRMVVASICLKG